MKHVFIFILCAALLPSCKKGYTCSCTDPTKSKLFVGQATYNEKDKAAAETKCQAKQAEYRGQPGNTYVECSIQ